MVKVYYYNSLYYRNTYGAFRSFDALEKNSSVCVNRVLIDYVD